MKKSFLLVFLAANYFLSAAQVPEFFSYQAIVRNAAGQPVVSQPVSILFTIYKTDPAGTNVYSEKHSPTTNEFGLVTLAIGNGTDKTGDFTVIDWGADIYFLNIKIDPSGGTTYTDMGTTQLLSVPYAMHAKTVQNNDDADADPENELQDLTIDDFSLGITDGSGVTIPSIWKRTDPDIYYDGGKVLISTTDLTSGSQLELADVFDAGGKNLVIGDDAYLSDIDQVNTLGIYGLEDPNSAAIKLGMAGPVLSTGIPFPVPGILYINTGSLPGIGAIKLGDIGPTLSNFFDPLILTLSDELNPSSGTIKLGANGPALSGTDADLGLDKNLNMNYQSVINVADPVNSQDAATKAYVDALVERIEILEGTKIKDNRDGKIYDIVEIGSQVWMAENLAYLPLVHSNAEFQTQGNNLEAGYGVYEYDGNDIATAKSQANYSTYGVLYNWWAAMAGEGSSSSNPSGVQGVCPTGWHLPSDDEWTTLENYLIANGYNYDDSPTENKIAKSLASASGWMLSSIEGAVGNTDYAEKRNATGFTALPGGYRHPDGAFHNIEQRTYWYSATEFDAGSAWSHNLDCNSINEGKWNGNKKYGFSVRCVKD